MRIPTLRALIGSIQKRFISTSISQPPPSKTTVDYLVNACGLTKSTAISAAQRIRIKRENLERCGSVVNFFRESGFSDSQLHQLVEKRPEILTIGLDGLKRKVQFLNENQLSGEYLVELLVSNPVILTRGVKSHLAPTLELLMKYLERIENVELALKRSSWLLTCSPGLTMQPNIELLIKEGVSLHSIKLMIVTKPRAALQKRVSMERAIKDVKELGIDPKSLIFIHAVCVRVSMSDATWNGKFDVFRSLGWTDDEIVSAFVRDPVCLACSEEKIRAVTKFIVESMGLGQEVIIGYPKLLMYSIEGRYKPRFYVLNVLKSKKLLKDDFKCVWAMTVSEEKFVETYVKKYEEQVPDLMKTYTTMRGNKSVN